MIISTLVVIILTVLLSITLSSLFKLCIARYRWCKKIEVYPVISRGIALAILVFLLFIITYWKTLPEIKRWKELFTKIDVQTVMLSKVLERDLVTQPIDDFKFNLKADTNKNLCILSYSTEQFPNFNFQIGNRYYLTGMYSEAIKKYKLAIEDLKGLTGEELRNLTLEKFTGDQLRASMLTVLLISPTESEVVNKMSDGEELRKVLAGKISEEELPKIAAKYSLSIDDLKNSKSTLTEKISDPRQFLWPIYNNLAIAYEYIDDERNAKIYAGKCLEINPNVNAAKKILGIE